MGRPVVAGMFLTPQISSVSFNSTVQVFKKDMIVHNPGLPCGVAEPQEADRKRGDIKLFSKASCRRAVFVANNSHGLISQFLCTYHDIPTDGRLIKKHLNRFLVKVRNHFNEVMYFWFLEFQQRGSPHFHVFLNIPTTDENRIKLADLWLTASDQDNDIATIKFHQHKKNFFDWDLSGPYVAKYASKEYQKEIPDNFQNVGRFWGATRGVAPPVCDVQVTPQVSRILKKLLLKRLVAKKKIPYRLWRAFKKTRRFIVSLDDADSLRIFHEFNVLAFSLFRPDLRQLPQVLLNI